jgi:hypothetical protein
MHRPSSRSDCDEDCVIVRPPSGLAQEEEARIEATFNSFGTNGEINGAKFAKFCRDNKLSGSKLSSTDIDLIFAKSKAKGARKLDFEQFRYMALPMVAKRKGADIDKLLRHICKHGGGPVFRGTKTEKVRHHDDRSTYTGVYSRGGPTNAHDQLQLGSATSGMKSLMDRSDYNIRGVKIEEDRTTQVQRVQREARARSAKSTFVRASSNGSGTVVPRSLPKGHTDDDNNADAGAGTITTGTGVAALVAYMSSLSIPSDSAKAYAARLVDDGFDAVADLKTAGSVGGALMEVDLNDAGMKKGHVRKVLGAAKVLSP